MCDEGAWSRRKGVPEGVLLKYWGGGKLWHLIIKIYRRATLTQAVM